MKPFLRTANNYDRDQVSLENGTAIDPETTTQQQFKDETDINTIVKRFGLTGELPNGIGMPQSGDFTDAPDFHTAMNLIRDAESAFLKVPAEIRARFNNDPGEIINFMENAANRDEAIKLGFIEKPPEVDRTGQPAPQPAAT